jgi:hypothetical protein
MGTHIQILFVSDATHGCHCLLHDANNFPKGAFPMLASIYKGKKVVVRPA